MSSESSQICPTGGLAVKHSHSPGASGFGAEIGSAKSKKNATP
jgi:hypothetical protein